MNKDLVLKISNHPMIKKLMESVDKKDIARLIVEELMNEEEEQSIFEKFRPIDYILPIPHFLSSTAFLHPFLSATKVILSVLKPEFRQLFGHRVLNHFW